MGIGTVVAASLSTALVAGVTGRLAAGDGGLGQTSLTVAVAGLIVGIPALVVQVFTIWGKTRDNASQIKLLQDRANFADEQARAARAEAARAEKRADSAEKRADAAHEQAAQLTGAVTANRDWMEAAHQQNPNRVPPAPPAVGSGDEIKAATTGAKPQ